MTWTSPENDQLTLPLENGCIPPVVCCAFYRPIFLLSSIVVSNLDLHANIFFLNENLKRLSERHFTLLFLLCTLTSYFGVD